MNTRSAPTAPERPGWVLDARQRAMLAEMGVRVWQAAPSAPAGGLQTAIVSRAAYASAASVTGPFDHQVSAPPGASPQTQAQAQITQPAEPPAHPTAAAQRASAPRPPARAARAPNAKLAPPAPLAHAGAVASIATSAPLDTPPVHDAATLRARILACQACPQGEQRVQPVMAADCLPAHWLVLGDAPDAAQARAGQPFVGEAGALLQAMLRAVAVQPDAPEAERRAHLSLAIKCCPARPCSLDAQALAACRAHLDAEIALVRPRVLLALGRWAIHTLLADALAGQRLVLSALRGRPWAYRGVPVVVSYPPHYLLTHPQDKRAAWDDLKLARRVVDAPDWTAQVLAQPSSR